MRMRVPYPHPMQLASTDVELQRQPVLYEVPNVRTSSYKEAFKVES
jgi:hypothetical protein